MGHPPTRPTFRTAVPTWNPGDTTRSEHKGRFESYAFETTQTDRPRSSCKTLAPERLSSKLRTALDRRSGVCVAFEAFADEREALLEHCEHVRAGPSKRAIMEFQAVLRGVIRREDVAALFEPFSHFEHRRPKSADESINKFKQHNRRIAHFEMSFRTSEGERFGSFEIQLRHCVARRNSGIDRHQRNHR